MDAKTLNRYQKVGSPIHRLAPRVKVVVTVLFMISTILLPDGAWLVFLITWGLILWISSNARLGPGYVIKRSFVALPFAMAAITTAFSLPGNPLATLTLGSLRLEITDAGFTRFVSIVVRSWLSVQMAILLTATTRFPDLMYALRQLHVPQLMIAIISLMYRYLFVLTDEATRLLRARQARSAKLSERGGGGSVMWRARVTGNMTGQLFLRSYERSDRIYNAMLARGYKGQTQKPAPIHWRNPEVVGVSPEGLNTSSHRVLGGDWAVGILAMVVLLLLQVIGRLSTL